MNKFLQSLEITFRRDPSNFRPRINKMNSVKVRLAIAFYCAFHKHANSKVQKPPPQLRFSLLSMIITITSNEPWNAETNKTDWNPPITDHKQWPFEPVKAKFSVLRGPLRWLTAAQNANFSWLLNFRVRVFLKSAVNQEGRSRLTTCQHYESPVWLA